MSNRRHVPEVPPSNILIPLDKHGRGHLRLETDGVQFRFDHKTGEIDVLMVATNTLVQNFSADELRPDWDAVAGPRPSARPKKKRKAAAKK